MLDLRLFDGEAAPAPANAETAKPTEVVYGIQDTPSEPQEETKETTEVDRKSAYESWKKENKDLFQADVDAIINKRFKEDRGLSEKLQRLDPVLNQLADKYGVDSGDIDGIVEAYLNDDSQLEELAEREGLTLEQTKRMRELENFKRTQEEAMNRQNAQATYDNWIMQADELQQLYPDFDLRAEAENQEFLKILKNGYTVQQAYELLHPEAQVDRIKREVSGKMAANVTRRQQRPTENGVSSASGIDVRTDVSSFTKEDRRKAIEQSRRNGSGSVRFS